VFEGCVRSEEGDLVSEIQKRQKSIAFLKWREHK